MSGTPKQWRRLLEAALTTADPARHEASLTDTQITAYVEAILAGQKPDQVWLGMQPDLERDTTGAEEIRELVEMFQADQRNDGVELKSQPVFDLSFLAKPRPSLGIPLPKQVQAAFAAGRAWLWDHSGALWVSFAAYLAEPLPRQPRLVTRSEYEEPAATQENILYQLSLGREELGDLDLEVKAMQAQELAYCTLLVTVRVPSRWPALAGVEVTVLPSDPPRTGVTDEEGAVRFERFQVADLARISFRVNPAPLRLK